MTTEAAMGSRGSRLRHAVITSTVCTIAVTFSGASPQELPDQVAPAARAEANRSAEATPEPGYHLPHLPL